MSYSCCSGNFSSRSCGGYQRYPSSCGSSYPSNLVYCTRPLFSQHLPAGLLPLQRLPGDLL
ncbi:LOW QUALITY PROTEIN: keratin-associated protein 23-1 [Suricata suricatta]|uniref:LOW QUALITY PROTEIN: keratin-associated protein 23-1 n=1 Tax=Suricata suricatta TaxID=37032 RepID=UPI0011557C73|nr:LOW QUALITY PROTEIN: keratin-associated protein 23-1 [Suricata suricatta]